MAEKLRLIFEEGFEEGWGAGYEAAVHFLVQNPTATERMRRDLHKDQIA